MDVSSLFKPGLYKITCIPISKQYIGQSENVLKRLGENADQLEKGKHRDCPAMQNDFKKYRKKDFKFEEIEIDNIIYRDDGFRKKTRTRRNR